MVIYWEYAFAENALLDGLLLYLALKCVRSRVRFLRLFLAAGLGGAEAVLFPLLTLPDWAAYAVKALGGILLCLAATSGGVKKCALSATAFFVLTFALGGALTAAYSYFGIETVDGTGFYVERAPVALVFAGAGIFLCAGLAGARALYRYKKMQQNLLPCRLTAGGKTVSWTGFADSGNCLTFRGEPVCVLSPAGVFALLGASPTVAGRIVVGTVNGTCERSVFRIEQLCVGTFCGGVYATVGDVGKAYQIILHTGILEGCHAHVFDAQGLAAKDKGRGKRHTLSLRK